ncbi:MAG: DNA recombination protein RmuC [Clostridia bacterium]|nr:DNA recombination protein RmuC [Clostridia bacterium]
MTDILLAVLIIVVLVAIGLLAVVLKTVKNSKTADPVPMIESTVQTQLAAFRSELTEREAVSRRETGAALTEMSEKIQAVTEKNYDFQMRFQTQLHEGLGMIREKQVETSARQTALITETIEKLQLSNEKKLEEMRTVVDEKLSATLSERLDSSFKTVSEQLNNVYKSLGEMKELSVGVTDNVTALNRVLTNVKARGTWAEVQLEAILDQTIPGMYVKNYSPNNSAERVEFAVCLPAGDDKKQTVYLPVDSKFPMEDYVRLCEAADKADAVALAAARKALEDRVLQEAKTVKKYIQVPQTTPYAVLYLATEGLYAEIAASKTGLMERIQHEYGVMIAGPSTVTALLNSFAMGFRTVAINEKANEIRLLLAAVKSQYENFAVLLDKAKKKVDEAGTTLESAQKRNSIIVKKLKGVEELDAGQAGELLQLPVDAGDE